MEKLKRVSIFLITVMLVFGAVSCGEEKVIPNPTPEKFTETFYRAWENSDAETIASLTCEPMWAVEAKSADVTVAELKSQVKEAYAKESGSKVYYKILNTKEYKETDEEYKTVYNWAKERYQIEIEGYAVVSVAVTYDNGEPVMEKMGLIKFEESWYARDLLGI